MNTSLPAGTLRIEGDIAVLAVQHPPVNALSQVVRETLVKGIAQAQAHSAVRAIVLICEGRTFLAGADITEFGKPPQAPSLFEAQEVIELGHKPVIAAIHGTSSM